MERQMQILAYLIARSISVHTGEAVQEIINEAVAATEEKEREVGEDAVERIYAQYPTRCPIRGTATGKCAKNKAQIRKLLKVHSEAELIYTIDRYVRDCTDGQCFLKNFGTFLNQLPDYGEDASAGIFAGNQSRPRPQ